jgi:hypothetical protein
MTGSYSASVVMRKNYAQEGGVIYIADTQASTISGAEFTGNKASSKGGLLVVQNIEPGKIKGTIIFEKCTITNH